MTTSTFKVLSSEDMLVIFKNKPVGAWLLRESRTPHMLTIDIKTPPTKKESRGYGCFTTVIKENDGLESYRFCYTGKRWRFVNRPPYPKFKKFDVNELDKVIGLLESTVQDLFTRFVNAEKRNRVKEVYGHDGEYTIVGYSETVKFKFEQILPVDEFEHWQNNQPQYDKLPALSINLEKLDELQGMPSLSLNDITLSVS